MKTIQSSIINIKNNNRLFVYGVEYCDTQTTIENSMFSYYQDVPSRKINFYNTNYTNIAGDVNDYYDIVTPGIIQYIPQNIHTSEVRIYIPQYCVDYFNHDYKYIIEISTYINGYKVILGGYLLDKNELLANTKPVKILDKVYYSGKTYTIIDPWYINYDTSWEQFREHVCGSIFYGTNELNNDTSLLNVEITPVIHPEDHWIKGIYTSGICQFMIALDEHNNLSLSTSINMDEINGLEFISNLHFNNAYTQDFAGLEEYVRSTYILPNTYGINTYISYILADKDGNFSQPVQILNDVEGRLTHTEYNEWVTGWDDWGPGLFISTIYTIYLVEDGIEADAPLLTMVAPDVPITKEIFKYMISNDNYIDLSTMNITTLNTVNKIEKKVINVERPDDYTAPVYMPIYIQANQTDDITIHTQVNESIAINLSAYINTVKVFSFMIGNTVFKEIARRGGNVIFKITGKLLPEEPAEGIYYILDETNGLVTTGNYKYI